MEWGGAGRSIGMRKMRSDGVWNLDVRHMAGTFPFGHVAGVRVMVDLMASL